MSPRPGRSQHALEAEARQALGKVSPELAWAQVQAHLNQCVEEYYQAAEELRLRYNLPVDLRSLQEVLADFNPVRGVNELHYSTPNLPLNDLMNQPPLKVLEAVLRMLLENDRLLGSKQVTQPSA